MNNRYFQNEWNLIELRLNGNFPFNCSRWLCIRPGLALCDCLDADMEKDKRGKTPPFVGLTCCIHQYRSTYSKWLLFKQMVTVSAVRHGKGWPVSGLRMLPWGQRAVCHREPLLHAVTHLNVNGSHGLDHVGVFSLKSGFAVRLSGRTAAGWVSSLALFCCVVWMRPTCSDK